MRAPKLYVLAILITICTLLAGGYAQTSKARTSPEVSDSQDARPKASNPGESTATGTLSDSTNSPPEAASGLQNPRSPAGQQRNPANPPTADQDLPSTAAHGSKAPIPQNVLFELFFNNMSALNKAAESDDKAGDHISAAAWRRYDQEAAGLNDAEGDILREIVLDCLRALKEQDVKIRASAEKDRAQRAPGVIGPTPPELIQLVEDRKKIVSDHIEKLREALGDASFNKLDAYVHSTFHAQAFEPKPAPPSTTIIGRKMS